MTSRRSGRCCSTSGRRDVVVVEREPRQGGDLAGDAGTARPSSTSSCARCARADPSVRSIYGRLDDGSTDGTLAILSDWQSRWSKGAFSICDGPRAGFAENFRALISNQADAHFFACCDQDDLWEPHTLSETALTWMRSQDGSHAAAFLFEDAYRFLNPACRSGCRRCFVENLPSATRWCKALAGGNTMVLNRTARDIVALASCAGYASSAMTGGSISW